jgi:hypothetical protein
MRDPQEFRELARRCREHARSSIDPDVLEQLRLWAAELADVADEIERSSGERARWRDAIVFKRRSAS